MESRGTRKPLRTGYLRTHYRACKYKATGGCLICKPFKSITVCLTSWDDEGKEVWKETRCGRGCFLQNTTKFQTTNYPTPTKK